MLTRLPHFAISGNGKRFICLPERNGSRDISEDKSMCDRIYCHGVITGNLAVLQWGGRKSLIGDTMVAAMFFVCTHLPYIT